MTVKTIFECDRCRRTNKLGMDTIRHYKPIPLNRILVLPEAQKKWEICAFCLKEFDDWMAEKK